MVIAQAHVRFACTGLAAIRLEHAARRTSALLRHGCGICSLRPRWRTRILDPNSHTRAGALKIAGSTSRQTRLAMTAISSVAILAQARGQQRGQLPPPAVIRWCTPHTNLHLSPPSNASLTQILHLGPLSDTPLTRILHFGLPSDALFT